MRLRGDEQVSSFALAAESDSESDEAPTEEETTN
jgi:hypothetical protein